MKKKTRYHRRVTCLLLLLILLLNAGAAGADSSSEAVKTVDPVRHPDNYSAVLYDNTNGLPTAEANAIVQTSEGFIWIGSYSGLIRYDHGTVTAFSEAEGMFSDRVRVVYESSDGAILAANTGGLCVIEGDAVTARYGEEDGLSNTEILTVVQAENGDFLLGSDGGGIYVVSDAGVRNITVEDGLPSDIVMRLKRDAKRDVTWIVTSNAIACMTPDYRVTTVQKFPYSNNFDLFENSKGDMWVLSSNGIYVTPAEALIANGEITPVYYSIASGLSCIATANSYSELTPEGDLYIAGTTGVCMVNIEQPLENVEDLKATVPFVEVDDDHLALVMADVSGKGVPAALFMVIAKALIKNRVMAGDSPAQALQNVNEQLCEGNEAELFVTVWLAVTELSTGKGVAANAGHEHPALRRAGGDYELVVYRHSPAVATMEGLRFREHEFQLNPGDSLFVYTDGVAEATNAQNELFGPERTLLALNRDPDADPKEILANVMRGIDDFVAEAEQFDDITMLCFRYKRPEQ